MSFTVVAAREKDVLYAYSRLRRFLRYADCSRALGYASNILVLKHRYSLNLTNDAVEDKVVKAV